MNGELCNVQTNVTHTYINNNICYLQELVNSSFCAHRIYISSHILAQSTVYARMCERINKMYK